MLADMVNFLGIEMPMYEAVAIIRTIGMEREKLEREFGMEEEKDE